MSRSKMYFEGYLQGRGAPVSDMHSVWKFEAEYKQH
jgi:hypothetical protein